MLQDKEIGFANAQALGTIADASSVASENNYHHNPILADNLTAGLVEIGTGQPLHIFVLVTTALVGASADLVVTLEADSTNAFPSATELYTLGTIPATSAAGYTLKSTIPQDLPVAASDAYYRLNFTASGAQLTSASVTAAIVHDLSVLKQYAGGYTV
jgi:hypothetical protein